MTIEWPEAVKEFAKLPALLSEFYGDLAKPGVRQVGKALETVVGLGNTILWPLALLNELARITLEKNIEKFRVRVENVPVNEIVQVAPEIGVPITEKLAYVNDEKLSDLYINLLAKAAVKASVQVAHPAFVNVINNLAPDEAVMIYRFTQGGYTYVRRDHHSKVPNRPPYQSLPEIDRTVIENEFPTSELTFPENFNMYVQHLMHLNLLTEKATGIHKRGDQIDVKLELKLSRFGELFRDACVPKEFKI